MFGKPQDLPSSRQFLVLCIAAGFITFFIGYRILFPSINPLAFSAAQTFLMGVTWITLLTYNRKISRWHQSASAMYGCSAITNLVSLPIYAHALQSGITASDGTLEAGALFLLLPRIWELAISALIIRETIEIRTGKSIGIAILISFAIEITLSIMFSPGK
jgi:hypothetical protein